MKIFYQPTLHSRKPHLTPGIEQPFLLLTRDNWNSQGYKTVFDLFLCKDGDFDFIGTLGITIGGLDDSHSAFDIEKESSPPNSIPFSITHPYLSLGSGLDLYKNLSAKIPYREFLDSLKLLHEVNYLEVRYPEHPDLALRSSMSFQKSVLAGSSALESMGKAKNVIFREEIPPSRYNFWIDTKLPNRSKLNQQFTFNSDLDMPSDIFVLIGKNGLGKTQLLYSILNGFWERRKNSNIRATNITEERPPFSRIISLALSPFEQFPKTLPRKGTLEYEYCGCRKNGFSIRAAVNSIPHLIEDIVSTEVDDLMYNNGKSRPRLASMMRALYDGIGIRDITVVKPGESPINLLERIDSRVDLANLAKGISSSSILIGDCSINQLSAGQKMFLLSAAKIVSKIHPGTLVLIDEPELYLHPNLECAYIKMLRGILSQFESKAIVATHSVFIARETPSCNIAILRQGDHGRTISTAPQFQTFGSGIGLIADYVFDNVSASKPFQDWLDSQAKNADDFNTLVDKLGIGLNAEATAYLRGKIRRQKNG